jgi:Fe-S cluster assembly protein SufD
MSLSALLDRARIEREAFKYTSLQPVRDVAFRPVVLLPTYPDVTLPPLLDTTSGRVVLVNGQMRPELSQLKNWPAEIHYDAATGYRLTLPPQSCLAATPLEILHIAVAAPQPQEIVTRWRLELGENARLTVLERFISVTQRSPQALVSELDIALAAQAKLVHIRLQEQGLTDFNLGKIAARLDKGAYYDQFLLTLGAALSRTEIDVHLAAAEAQTRLHGLTLLAGKQHGDVSSKILHDAPHTSSQQHYRTVLDGAARGVFQGKIIVAPVAQKTSGQQMKKALLLSELAEMNAKPELEIHAEDVQCSHGATIGQLDKAALFYLRSRGIKAQAAQAMLVSAFGTEIIELIATDAGRRAAQALAELWYAQRVIQ